MSKTPVVEVPVDEQDAPWPPAEGLYAIVKDFSDEYDGQVVEVSTWLNRFGWFECILTIGAVNGSPLFLGPHELEPMNKATVDYMAEVQAAAVEVYDTDEYDLRDQLDEVGVAVKVESVATWTGAQRKRIRAWMMALTEWRRVSGSLSATHPTIATPPEVA